MRFLAVDDEKIMLEQLEDMLCRIRPEAEIAAFARPDEALEAAKRERVDAAFLEIRGGGMTGLELAEKLKKVQPDIQIVFVTGYQEYALDAFAIHATGYLLKPVSEEALRRELNYICRKPEGRGRIRVQTFGGFEIYVDGQPVKFARTKAKELLAYLIDHRGAAVTTREACAALFEDDSGTRMGYFRNILRELKNALQNAGAQEILERSFNSLAVAAEKIDCDYYRFLEGDPAAVNRYQNDYMPSYSWAEPRNATLGFVSGKNQSGA